MLRRRAVNPLLLALALLGAAAASAADRPRVVLVKSAALGPYAQVSAGFIAEVQASVEEVTLGEGAAASERTFKQLGKPALVLAVGPAAAVGARQHLPDVPLVFVMVPYFQKYELDGANVTGIALTSDLSLELAALRATWPQVKRVGVLADLRYSKKYLDDAAVAAQGVGATLVPVDLDSPQKVDRALAGAKGRVDALIVISDKTVGSAAVVERVLAFAQEERLPAVGLVPSLVGRGAVLALSPSPLAIGQQAGRLANRVLVEKVDPGALAVANPEGVELHVDLAQAVKLGAKDRFASDLLRFAAEHALPVRPAQ